MWFIVAGLAAVAYLTYKYFDGNGDYWEKLGVDSLGKSELATFWERITFKVNLAEYDQLCYNRFKGQRYGGVVEFRQPSLYVRDLELIKKMMVKDFDHFTDRRIIDLNKSDAIFSKMLTNKSGKEWKDLRSVMSPTFSTGKIKRMFEHFNNCGNRLATYLRNLEKTDNKVDFQDAFGRYTVDVIASIVFGIETDVFTNEESYFRRMAKKMQTFTAVRFAKLLLFILVPKLAKNLGLSVLEKESTHFFLKVIEQSVQKRRELGEKRQDFLQIMLEAQAGQVKADESEMSAFERDAVLTEDKTEQKGKKDLAVTLDDETVMAQTMLFFVAGFDTVEALLDFVIYELAINPVVQERLAEEVTAAMEETQGVLEYETANSLEYLDMVISETLRHHSPAFATERTVTRNYQVPDSDLVLPVGMRIIVPINSIHHDPEYYTDPDKFNPEHFSAENKAKRHPYAYMPFGQGPRNCIAMRFAITEVKAAIAHLVYNFKVEPYEKTQIPMQVSNRTTTKKPKDGVWLQFHARETTSEGFVKL